MSKFASNELKKASFKIQLTVLLLNKKSLARFGNTLNTLMLLARVYLIPRHLYFSQSSLSALATEENPGWERKCGGLHQDHSLTTALTNKRTHSENYNF